MQKDLFPFLLITLRVVPGYGGRLAAEEGFLGIDADKDDILRDSVENTIKEDDTTEYPSVIRSIAGIKYKLIHSYELVRVKQSFILYSYLENARACIQ